MLAGICGGPLYDLFFVLSYPFRKGWVRYVTDALFFVLFAALYLFLSVLFELPSLRFYMFAACLLGLLLYWKSIHKIVAFFSEKLYTYGRRKVKAGRLWRKKRKKTQSAQSASQ